MHTVETGTTVRKFPFITSISNPFSISKIKEFDYIILVEDEDSVDIWGTNDHVRGTNDLVNYYYLWNKRDINEQDLVVLCEWPC